MLSFVSSEEKKKRRWSTCPLNSSRREDRDYNLLVQRMHGVDEEVHSQYFQMSADRLDDLVYCILSFFFHIQGHTIPQ